MRGAGRAPGVSALRVLRDELAPEGIRAGIPDAIAARRGRIIYTGEVREQRDKVIPDFDLVASTTRTFRSVVTLQRSWYLCGCGATFPPVLTGMGVGEATVTLFTYAPTPRGRIPIATSLVTDPHNAPGVLGMLAPVGGRIDVDLVITLAAAQPTVTVHNLIVSAWGMNSYHANP